MDHPPPPQIRPPGDDTMALTFDGSTSGQWHTKWGKFVMFHWTMWMFPKIGFTPKSSILIRFSIINHPFWGTTNFWKHPCSFDMIPKKRNTLKHHPKREKMMKWHLTLFFSGFKNLEHNFCPYCKQLELFNDSYSSVAFCVSHPRHSPRPQPTSPSKTQSCVQLASLHSDQAPKRPKLQRGRFSQGSNGGLSWGILRALGYPPPQEYKGIMWAIQKVSTLHFVCDFKLYFVDFPVE